MEGGGQNRGRGDTMDTMDRQIQKPVCFFLFTIRMTILSLQNYGKYKKIKLH